VGLAECQFQWGAPVELAQLHRVVARFEERTGEQVRLEDERASPDVVGLTLVWRRCHIELMLHDRGIVMNASPEVARYPWYHLRGALVDLGAIPWAFSPWKRKDHLELRWREMPRSVRLAHAARPALLRARLVALPFVILYQVLAPPFAPRSRPEARTTGEHRNDISLRQTASSSGR
jgi:hypothetical protein